MKFKNVLLIGGLFCLFLGSNTVHADPPKQISKYAQRFSPEEDEKIKTEVSAFGNNKIDWNFIKENVENGRTAKQCETRYHHYIKPPTPHHEFAQEEIYTLLSLYKQYGSKWKIISQQIPGTTPQQCFLEFRKFNGPTLFTNEQNKFIKNYVNNPLNRKKSGKID